MEYRSESEVMTAMMNDKDRFTVTELSALRSDLLQSGMMDSREAAELLQVFLMGRGYGVSQAAALDAAGRVAMAGCALPVLQHELENLALVMERFQAVRAGAPAAQRFRDLGENKEGSDRRGSENQLGEPRAE